MSANRWEHCPKCGRNREAKLRAAQVKLSESYGKVSHEEWERLHSYVNELSRKRREGEKTLREDWECGLIDNPPHGEESYFTIGYFASCKTCGFEFNFSKKVPLSEVLPEDEPGDILDAEFEIVGDDKP